MGDNENKKVPVGERGAMGDAPVSAGLEANSDEERRRCASERDALTPKESADCAGIELAEEYENEEDGGS